MIFFMLKIQSILGSFWDLKLIIDFAVNFCCHVPADLPCCLLCCWVHGSQEHCSQSHSQSQSQNEGRWCQTEGLVASQLGFPSKQCEEKIGGSCKWQSSSFSRREGTTTVQNWFLWSIQKATKRLRRKAWNVGAIYNGQNMSKMGWSPESGWKHSSWKGYCSIWIFESWLVWC